MANFTTPDSAADITHIDFLNELLNALYERHEALGLINNPWAPIAAGVDLQEPTFWSDMQTWIEDHCTGFVDHTIAGGNFHGEADIPNFTLATFRAAAGLHSSGFRRVESGTDWDPAVNDWTNIADPMFTYGIHGAGDIVLCPWMLTELQAALSTLKWTSVGYSSTLYDSRGDSSILKPNCAAVLADLHWYDFESSGTGNLYWVKGGVRQDPNNYTWDGFANRRRGKPGTTIPTIVACDCDIYCYIAPPQPTTDYQYIGDYVDVDALGVPANTWAFYETLAAVDPPVAARQALTWYGNLDDPISVLSLACPQSYKGAQATDATFICKWQFTHANP